MATQAADHYKNAAEQHEKAAHHVPLAHGESPQAIHHGTEAAKAPVEHHGTKSRSRQGKTEGAYGW